MSTIDTESGKSDTILDIPLSQVCLSYGRFRFIRPQLYTAMRRSIKRYGQITPVIVTRLCNSHGSYELIDGFKRYHGLQDLGKESIRIRIVTLGLHASKVALIHFNKTQGSMSVLEESLIITSLYREDKLNQVEIGVLFCKDKSWVCRRIALCERLSDEVIEHLRLGLICKSIARELSRLPRGNQKKVLSCILKHHLTSHETRKLVTDLLQSPRWEHDLQLYLPLDILEQRTPPKEKIPDNAYKRFLTSLNTIEMMSADTLYHFLSGSRDLIQIAIERISRTKRHLDLIQTNLEERISYANTIHTEP